ncbi:TIGR01548 family HAD-type hydrolase [Phormidesmis sp. 146-33]
MSQAVNLKGAIVIFDIDGVVRDVSGSYRRALADTVEKFTQGAYRPSSQEIDALKAEGVWNNDWEASQELTYRYFEAQGTSRSSLNLDYSELVAFFQSRYRGTDPDNWTGYICQEPLLMQPKYLDSLTEAGIHWGFFSGATRASANYILEKRLGLRSPLLVAMEDAPGKPDPTGLFASVQSFAENASLPVIYVGDTVADMYTVERARQIQPDRRWIGVGVLPPHVQETSDPLRVSQGDRQSAYAESLRQAGAEIVFANVQELTAIAIQQLVRT